MLWCSLPLALLVASHSAAAQCGEWGEGFEYPGASDSVCDFAVFDDGAGPQLYASGWFDLMGGIEAQRIARWDGESWSAVGFNNVLSVAYVNDLEVIGDGSSAKLYVGGRFSSPTASDLAVWDGSSWSGLGQPSGNVLDIQGFDDGAGTKVYITGPSSVVTRLDAPGSWSTVGTLTGVGRLEVYDDGSGPELYVTTGSALNGVARWDGAEWQALGAGLDGYGSYLTVHTDASGSALIVAGGFTTAGGVPALGIARWDGSHWSALGAGVAQPVRVLNSVGGTLYAGTDTAVLAWDGTGWNQVGGSFSDTVKALELFDDGNGSLLHVGGQFLDAGGANLRRVARFEGTDWEPIASGDWLDGPVEVLTVHDDGSGEALYVGGEFTEIGEVPYFHLARWDGSTWSDVGGGVEVLGGGTAKGIEVRAMAEFDYGSGTELFVGGRFDVAGGKAAMNIARWDGSTWSALGSGLNKRAKALAVFDDGSGEALYVGGGFTVAGGQTVGHIARWDIGWSAIPGLDDDVNSLLVFDDGTGPALYAGGKFRYAGGSPAQLCARWDGASWKPMSGLSISTTDPQVDAMIAYDEGVGPHLFVVGAFQNLGRIARWDGLGWSAVGSYGFDSRAMALATWDDGSGARPKLVVGGKFEHADGLLVERLAAWDGQDWSAFDDGSGAVGANRDVNALAVFHDGNGLWPALHVGGALTSLGSVSSGRFGRWEVSCACQGSSYCTAGTSASGCIATIGSQGAASRSAGSGFTVSIAQVEGGKDGLLYFSTHGPQAVPWGNGTSFQCVAPPVRRTGTQPGVGSAGTCQGVFQLDFNAWMAANPSKAPQAGEVAQMQAWFRDPFSTSSLTTSLSDALRFSVCP